MNAMLNWCRIWRPWKLLVKFWFLTQNYKVVSLSSDHKTYTTPQKHIMLSSQSISWKISIQHGHRSIHWSLNPFIYPNELYNIHLSSDVWAMSEWVMSEWVSEWVSGGFTPCWHLRPFSWWEHNSYVRILFTQCWLFLMNKTRRNPYSSIL